MPRSNEDDFFETREDWSRRKHLILEHYLPPATAKLRHVSPDRRVIILDGFAGRGHYEDGTQGSPIQMGLLADKVRAWKDPVDLQIFNVEANPEHHTELDACTEQWVKQGVITNQHAPFSKALPTILSHAASSPLFAFLDPFRPTDLPFADLKPLLTRNAVTELLIVFHTPAVWRIIQQVGPHAKTDAKTRQSSSNRLTAIFGSQRWDELLQGERSSDAVVPCFVQELAEHCHLPGRSLFICDTPIQARYGRELKYHIIFVTRHFDGVRLINDAFVKEKRDIHSKTVAGTTASLFEEFADPHDPVHRLTNTQNAVLEAIRNDPDRIWSFSELMLQAMRHRLGLFSETDYKQAVRSLLESTPMPRLVGVKGKKLQNGKWKVEDNLALRLAV